MKRSNFQALIWKTSLTGCPDIPDPAKPVWLKLSSDGLYPQFMTKESAPKESAIIELVSCGCKQSNCQRNCVCSRHELSCTEACLCTGSNICDNKYMVMLDNESSEDEQ